MLIYKMKMIQLQLRKLMLANMALLGASITQCTVQKGYHLGNERQQTDFWLCSSLTLASCWMILCRCRLIITEPKKRSRGEQR